MPATSPICRWLALAWLCFAQSVTPSRIVHAHAGGEAEHSRFESHAEACIDGEGLPGRHAHYVILGWEVHIPLPLHDEPAGFSEEDGFAIVADDVQLTLVLAAEALPPPAPVLFELIAFASAPSWSADLPPPDLPCCGKHCRILLTSLTL